MFHKIGYANTPIRADGSMSNLYFGVFLKCSLSAVSHLSATSAQAEIALARRKTGTIQKCKYS